MNKALAIAAAVSLAVSGAAFAGGTSHSKSSARTGASAGATQFTETDCQMLRVESARSACMRSAQANVGAKAAIGATSDSGDGTGQGGAGPAATSDASVSGELK